MRSIDRRLADLERQRPTPVASGPEWQQSAEEAAEVLRILDEAGALTEETMRAAGWPQDVIDELTRPEVRE